MRSKLFVPASRPELIEKALTCNADGISFDLEDAVLEHRKAYARDMLHELFQSSRFKELREAHKKKIIVRVNAMDTPHFEEDLAVSCTAGVDVINVPKIETRQDALASAQALERQASKVFGPNGGGGSSSSGDSRSSSPASIVLLANIETPTAL